MITHQQPNHTVVIVHRIWEGRKNQEESIEIVIDGELRYKDAFGCNLDLHQRARCVYGAMRQIRERNMLPDLCERFKGWRKVSDFVNKDVAFDQFLGESGVKVYVSTAHVRNQYDL